MNWKTFGSALLVTIIIFAIVFLIAYISHLWPWFLLIVAFLAATLLIYDSMIKSDKEQNKE